MKRVVTGNDPETGRAIFVAVGPPVHQLSVTALGWEELWSTFPEDTLLSIHPATEPSRTARWNSVHPRPGQSSFRIVEFRPDEHDPKRGALWTDAETDLIRRDLPGVLEQLEAVSSGMHKTDSVDYGIVLSGRIRLEVDDEKSVELEAGDVVVQLGTRHAWHPLERTRMAFVMIGVSRE